MFDILIFFDRYNKPINKDDRPIPEYTAPLVIINGPIVVKIKPSGDNIVIIIIEENKTKLGNILTLEPDK